MVVHSKAADFWSTDIKQPADFGKVVVLMGGRSAERDVSLKSGSMVLQALQARGVDAHGFDPAEQSITALAAGGFQSAFIALHGRLGEDGCIQGVLEWLSIPYTGSAVLASALAMDKILTKQVWLANQLPSPNFMMLEPNFDVDAVIDLLGLPLIIKPSQEGSTLGLTKVKTREQLLPAFELAYRHDRRVLAEALIVGEEVTVPIVGQGDQAKALPVIKIVAPDGNYDYHNKYLGHETQYLCPSGLSLELEQTIQQLVERAYRVLDCSGWGRADVMLDAQRRPWLLEMNTSPGMTDHSLVPMSAKALGIRYDDLVLRLLSTATLNYSSNANNSVGI